LSLRRPYGLALADGHFSRTPVTQRLQQPTRASTGPDQPARRTSREAAARTLIFGLAPGGVCRASRVAPAAGALLPHRFTLTAAAIRRGLKATRGGLLSVALSRALRPVGVTDHPVLWSPDFPLLIAGTPQRASHTSEQRPSGPLRDYL